MKLAVGSLIPCSKRSEVKWGEPMEQRTPEGKAAKIEYIMRYNKEKYDKITFTVPKGEKEKIKKNAAGRGLNMNQYIQTSIDFYEENN